ncbi:peptidoglycan-binding protein [Alicyclobacillus dauci]|uniref:Peptidoglycan-binding protein n=1 Tax=Alicyclobacillus dauci TaxID=1475485 RepID=A0ABY6Z1P0_9BACL|nr:peptidoglycan-binding protein [Alicyclobacillus dauci]WAH36799.1 peptidoglycan-binding protein [Alicyclobacillus dauci]
MKFRSFLLASSFPVLFSVAAPVVVHAQTSEPTLKSGSTGSAVMTLQRDLNSLGFSAGSVDGGFGPKTLSAVKSFQRSRHLQVDGVVGPATWNAILSSLHGKSFTNVDLRDAAPNNVSASSIDAFLSKNGAPMKGLGRSFVNAQNTYGVDANYLVSHAILESAWGKSAIALAKNNLFGYGAYDANPGNDAGMFPSDDYAIQFQAWEVRNNYLNPGASEYVSPTLNGMNVHYATDPYWANSIASLMNQLASSVGGSVNDYPQYPAAIVQQPQSATEPVFNVNGAVGTTQANSYYGGAPYYPSMGDGMADMFFGPLRNGSSGEPVAEIQKYLNSHIGAGLKVDGQFGPGTAAAVKKFEAKQGFAQDGVWSYSMWTTYIYTGPAPTLPAGQSVNIDEIEQGMAGAYVVPWYHIANVGWVDSQYVKFTNVYRVTVPSQTSTNTSVPVYSSSDGSQQIATLHNGDFVVAQTTSPNNGMYEIQLYEQSFDTNDAQSPGTSFTGYVSAQNAKLTPQH